MSDKKKVDLKGVVSDIALGVWGDLEQDIPDIIKSIAGPTDTALQGQFKVEIEGILKKMAEDLVAFKNKEIDRLEFEQITMRRKAGIYGFFNANKISHQRPSVQKILDAVESIVTTIILKGIPVLIAAAL
jgi:hypothetical protein